MMKCVRVGRVLVGAFVLTASLVAQAQVSGPAAASAAASAAMTPKEIKAANRALQRKVVTALAKTKGLTVTNIAVRARNGDVTLEGTVPEQSQMDLAVRAAQAVPGVTSVKSSLALSTF
jgi:hyperosmotically inducible periplasmic protein